MTPNGFLLDLILGVFIGSISYILYRRNKDKEDHKNMIGKLLCRLGLHKYPEGWNAQPRKDLPVGDYKVCKRCGLIKHEIYIGPTLMLECPERIEYCGYIQNPPKNGKGDHEIWNCDRCGVYAEQIQDMETLRISDQPTPIVLCKKCYGALIVWLGN